MTLRLWANKTHEWSLYLGPMEVWAERPSRFFSRNRYPNGNWWVRVGFMPYFVADFGRFFL